MNQKSKQKGTEAEIGNNVRQQFLLLAVFPL